MPDLPKTIKYTLTLAENLVRQGISELKRRPRDRELVTCFSEELGELAMELLKAQQVCHKHLRFAGNKKHFSLSKRAMAELRQEIGDVTCLLEMLQIKFDFTEEEISLAITKKSQRLKKYTTIRTQRVTK